MAFGEWETYDHPVACEHTRSLPTDAAHESSQNLQQALSFRQSCTAVRVLLMKFGTTSCSEYAYCGAITNHC